MKKLWIPATLVLSLVIMFLVVSTAQATMPAHCGNQRYRDPYGGYGVKALITTSYQRPQLYPGYPSLVCSWVSTTGGTNDNHVQSGWINYYGSANASSFIEYIDFWGTQYMYYRGGYQSWNTQRSYEVVWAGGNYWIVNIGGTDYGAYGGQTMSAPVPAVEAMSEVKGSNQNQLNALFRDCMYRRQTTNDYHWFDQAHWHDEPAEGYTCWHGYGTYDDFDTHGHGM